MQIILVVCQRAGEQIIFINEFRFGFAGPNFQPAAWPSFPGPSEMELEDSWSKYSLLVLSSLSFIPSPSDTDDRECGHAPLALFSWGMSACLDVPSTSPKHVPNNATCLDVCLSSSRESKAWWQQNARISPPCKLLHCSYWLYISLLRGLGTAVTRLVHHSQKFSTLMWVLAVLLVKSICWDIWANGWTAYIPCFETAEQGSARRLIVSVLISPSSPGQKKTKYVIFLLLFLKNPPAIFFSSL